MFVPQNNQQQKKKNDNEKVKNYFVKIKWKKKHKLWKYPKIKKIVRFKWKDKNIMIESRN